MAKRTMVRISGKAAATLDAIAAALDERGLRASRSDALEALLALERREPRLERIDAAMAVPREVCAMYWQQGSRSAEVPPPWRILSSADPAPSVPSDAQASSLTPSQAFRQAVYSSGLEAEAFIGRVLRTLGLEGLLPEPREVPLLRALAARKFTADEQIALFRVCIDRDKAATWLAEQPPTTRAKAVFAPSDQR